ncbi:hypothetical protein [Pedobacter sp.]|uniref:pirin family protein n=1 Tax=Pedobacter sp. TaxID=1411316 RepID=UPI003C4D82A1
MQNNSKSIDAEFVEIKTTIVPNAGTLFLENQNPFRRNALNDFFVAQKYSGKEKRGIQLYRGRFEKGSGFTYPARYKSNYAVVFILKGELLVNGMRMTNRDTVLFSRLEKLDMEFTEETSFLLFEINRKN